MDFLPMIILILVVILLATFVRDQNKRRFWESGGGGKERVDAFGRNTFLPREGRDVGVKSLAGDHCNVLLPWLGFIPRHRSNLSSGQWSFETVEAAGGDEKGLLRDVGTAQKWNLIYLVSPQGELEAYDEQRARALENRVRTAYGDLDFQWTFATRLRFLGPVGGTAGVGDTLGAFTDGGFVLERLPDWESMECEKVVVASYDTPKSISGLVVGDGRLTRTEKIVELKIAPLPFVRKTDESAFYALEVGAGPKDSELKVQALKSVPEGISTGELCAERYAVTNFLLAIFTQRVQSEGLIAEHLIVPSVKIVKTMERRSAFHGILQPLELHSWNSIDFMADSTTEKDRKVAAFLQAFMHWTYHRTNGELLLVVKKGVKMNGCEYSIVDPEIYAKDFSRFGSTTMGRDGMAAFWEMHTCNHLCERLITAKPKGLKRASRRETSRRSIKDSAKTWSLSSFHSTRDLAKVDTGVGDWFSPRTSKPAKCDVSPLWRALKRNKRL